jgi:hypothetical protein
MIELHKGSSINNVKIFGGGDQEFCDNKKASEIVTMVGGG